MHLGWIGAVVFWALLGCQSKPKNEMPPEKASVREIIMSHVGDVADCYTATLKRNPKFTGKLVLEWEVNPIGDPKDITVIQSAAPKLDKCISEKLANWAFSPPPNNQVMRVRYPFVFSERSSVAPAPGETVVGNMRLQILDPIPPAVPSGKKCAVVEREYAQLCVRDDKSGECVLDDNQMSQLLRLFQDSSKLPMAYLADLDRMLKNASPSEGESKAIQGKLTEDCWTSIHVRMWNSVFHTFKSTAGHPQLAEAKDTMRQRVTELEVSTPTLVALQMDLTILERAEESGFLKISGQAKAELAHLRSQGKKLVKDFSKEDKTTTDPLKVVIGARRELKAVKPVRTRLRDWSKKYWKKF